MLPRQRKREMVGSDRIPHLQQRCWADYRCRRCFPTRISGAKLAEKLPDGNRRCPGVSYEPSGTDDIDGVSRHHIRECSIGECGTAGVDRRPCHGGRATDGFAKGAAADSIEDILDRRSQTLTRFFCRSFCVDRVLM